MTGDSASERKAEEKDDNPAETTDAKGSDDETVLGVCLVLAVVSERLNAIMFELLDACVERTRQEGVAPTVHDVACLGMQATRVLTIWHDDLQEF